MKEFTNVFDALRYLEERDIKFLTVTRLSIDDVLTFYLATGRYPDENETSAIRMLGIEMAIQIIQAGDAKKTFERLQSLKNDLEKVHAARFRFVEVLKRELKKIFS